MSIIYSEYHERNHFWAYKAFFPLKGYSHYIIINPKSAEGEEYALFSLLMRPLRPKGLWGAYRLHMHTVWCFQLNYTQFTQKSWCTIYELLVVVLVVL